MDVEETAQRAELEQESEHTWDAADGAAGAPEPSRKRRPLRAVAMAALVVCLVITGATSVVLASRANLPSATVHPFTPDISLAQANPTTYPTPAPQHTVTIVSNPGKSHSQTQTLAPQPPSGAGQEILVSLSKQQLWAYQNGKQVYTTLVTTGMPALATPTGTFSIYYKVADTMFISPWPPGSPYYYSPEHVNYAMEFLTGGYFIHDAPWRSVFGPGTEAQGSHGCVEVPTPAGAWLYSWVGYGATVEIVS